MKKAENRFLLKNPGFFARILKKFIKKQPKISPLWVQAAEEEVWLFHLLIPEVEQEEPVAEE